jgi:general secretion pathway protein G
MEREHVEVGENETMESKEILKSARGFSLIEILIALTLLGIAGTFVMGKIFDKLHEGQVQAAKVQMGNFAKTLKDFRRKCNFYPTTEQGLQALLEKPTEGRECKRYPSGGFLDSATGSVPQDPWDCDYNYKLEGKKKVILWSLGPDCEEGGEGKDADVYLNDEDAPEGGGEDEG